MNHIARLQELVGKIGDNQLRAEARTLLDQLRAREVSPLALELTTASQSLRESEFPVPAQMLADLLSSAASGLCAMDTKLRAARFLLCEASERMADLMQAHMESVSERQHQSLKDIRAYINETAPAELSDEDYVELWKAMPANARDTLRCLCQKGPTWDGDVPSKAGRDLLLDCRMAVKMVAAKSEEGYQAATYLGRRVYLLGVADEL